MSSNKYPRGDSNPHVQRTYDFESHASTSSATRAISAIRVSAAGSVLEGIPGNTDEDVRHGAN